MQGTTSSTRTFITPSAPKPEPTTPKEPKQRRALLGKKQLPWIIVILLVLVSGGLFWQYRIAQNKLNANASSAAQINNLVAQVKKVAVLPANETPTVATVIHADKLKSQTFFANAMDGDKVLVFSQEKEAILFRPSTNQIVTIAPVNVTPTTDTTNLSK